MKRYKDVCLDKEIRKKMMEADVDGRLSEKKKVDLKIQRC